jgi:hypothetical protein
MQKKTDKRFIPSKRIANCVYVNSFFVLSLHLCQIGMYIYMTNPIVDQSIMELI